MKKKTKRIKINYPNDTIFLFSGQRDISSHAGSQCSLFIIALSDSYDDNVAVRGISNHYKGRV